MIETERSLLRSQNETASIILVQRQPSRFSCLETWIDGSRSAIFSTTAPEISRTLGTLHFFSTACGTVGITGYPEEEMWTRLNRGVFLDTALNWSRATLFFEFEIMNSEFHKINGGAFTSLSFLNIHGYKKWGAFDAFMIVPAIRPTEQFRGAFVGIEAKLASDISRHTKRFRYVNQIMRNVEAGYWLTHHHESLYQGWQFHYLFVCPKSDFEMKAAHYAWMLADDVKRREACDNYRQILSFHRASVDEQQFGAFSRLFQNQVTVLHWDQIANVLRQQEPRFLENYFDALAAGTGLSTIIGNTRLRLLRAGVECP